MQCHQCGYEMNDDSIFCSRCGAKLEQGISDPINQQAYQAAAAYYQPETETKEKTNLARSTPANGQDTRKTLQQDSFAQNASDVDDQAFLHARRLAYVRHDYDPRRDGYLRQTSPAAYGPPQNQAAAADAKPSSTGMIVFSIINMLCCGLFVSLILGTIALVHAITASGETVPERAVSKLNTARVLNVIGLVFVIIQFIVFFVVVVGSLLLSRNFIV